MPFHTDYSRKTMQVALNDDFTGGQLVFATGEGFFVPPRPAGTATVHKSQQVHGVAKLEADIRFGLFLCHTGAGPTAAAEGGYHKLLTPTLAQLTFFEEALPWLESASDDDLGRAITAYAAFLRAAGGASPPLAAPSLGLEVVWRTHMLNPEAYLRACAAITGGAILDHDPGAYHLQRDSRAQATAIARSLHVPCANATDLAWLGLDLADALRRQASFMRPFGRARGWPGGSFGRILGLPDRGEPFSSRHTRADSGGRFALAHAHAFPAQVHARFPAPHRDAAAPRRRGSALPENMNGRPGQLAQCHSPRRAGKLQAVEGSAIWKLLGGTVRSLLVVSGCCWYRNFYFRGKRPFNDQSPRLPVAA